MITVYKYKRSWEDTHRFDSHSEIVCYVPSLEVVLILGSSPYFSPSTARVTTDIKYIDECHRVINDCNPNKKGIDIAIQDSIGKIFIDSVQKLEYSEEDIKTFIARINLRNKINNNIKLFTDSMINTWPDKISILTLTYEKNLVMYDYSPHKYFSIENLVVYDSMKMGPDEVHLILPTNFDNTVESLKLDIGNTKMIGTKIERDISITEEIKTYDTLENFIKNNTNYGRIVFPKEGSDGIQYQ